jgi:hypothetical protein
MIPVMMAIRMEPVTSVKAVLNSSCAKDNRQVVQLFQLTQLTPSTAVKPQRIVRRGSPCAS